MKSEYSSKYIEETDFKYLIYLLIDMDRRMSFQQKYIHDSSDKIQRALNTHPIIPSYSPHVPDKSDLPEQYQKPRLREEV
jgi:hypothetical protein